MHAADLRRIAEDASLTVSGPLHIGSFRTLSSLIIPDLCGSFATQFPGVKLTVTEGDEASLIMKLIRGDISVAFAYRVNMPEELAFEPLAELPTYVLLPADHPLADRPLLTLVELVGIPFILLDMPLTRDYFLAMFTRFGLTPHIAAKSEYSETVWSYVASGFGFSLATARPRNKAAPNGRPLAYVRLGGNFEPMLLGIVAAKDLRRTRVIVAFEEHCRRFMSSTGLPGMADWEERSLPR